MDVWNIHVGRHSCARGEDVRLQNCANKLGGLAHLSPRGLALCKGIEVCRSFEAVGPYQIVQCVAKQRNS